MKIIKTEINGIFIIEPKIYKDSRGYFYESYSKKDFDEEIGKICFVQDNQSCSIKGVIRGLHFQKPPYSQAKLVRCVKGSVLDVAVDLRKNSETFGKHIIIELSENNHRELFIPKGFAHGFEVLSEIAIFQYKCDEYYHPETEEGINPFDKTLNIKWKVSPNEAIISNKDLHNPSFSDFITPFSFVPL